MFFGVTRIQKMFYCGNEFVNVRKSMPRRHKRQKTKYIGPVGGGGSFEKHGNTSSIENAGSPMLLGKNPPSYFPWLKAEDISCFPFKIRPKLCMLIILYKKYFDKDEIRTHAGRAQQISSLSP